MVTILSVSITTAFKHGTFLYLKNLTVNDIIETWHITCAKCRVLQKKNDSLKVYQDPSSQMFSSEEGSIQSQFYNILSTFNDHLRKQAKVITNNFVTNPAMFDDFDFETSCSMFDPLIWNTVSMLSANADRRIPIS